MRKKIVKSGALIWVDNLDQNARSSLRIEKGNEKRPGIQIYILRGSGIDQIELRGTYVPRVAGGIVRVYDGKKHRFDLTPEGLVGRSPKGH